MGQCLPSTTSSLISSLHVFPHVFPPGLPSMSSHHVAPFVSFFSSPFSFLSSGDLARVREGVGHPSNLEGSPPPPHPQPSPCQNLPGSSGSAMERGWPQKATTRHPEAAKTAPTCSQNCTCGLAAGGLRDDFLRKLLTLRSKLRLPCETHVGQLGNQHLGTLWPPTSYQNPSQKHTDNHTRNCTLSGRQDSQNESPRFPKSS